MATFAAQPKVHVSSTPGGCGGKPCIVGTRIRVWDIASLAQAGQSLDDILTAFPQLTLADVHLALVYHFDNREAIDAQMAGDDRLVQDLRQRVGAGPLEQKFAEEAKTHAKP